MMKIKYILLTLALTVSCFANADAKKPRWGFLYYINTENNLAESGNHFYYELMNLIESYGMKDEHDFAIILKSTNEDLQKKVVNKKPNFTLKDKPVFKYLLYKNGVKYDLTSQLKGINPDLSKIETFEFFLKDVHPKLSNGVDKTFLTFWGHGMGWNEGSLLPSSTRKIIIDEDLDQAWERTRKPGFTIVELAKVLDKFPKWDVISFDQCLMATIEVAYELRKSTKYLLASETTLSSLGYSYIPMMKMPEDTLEFLKQIANASANRILLDSNLVKPFAMSVIDVSKVESFVVKFNDYLNDVLAYTKPVRDNADNFKSLLDGFLGKFDKLTYFELANIIESIHVEKGDEYGKNNVDLGTMIKRLGKRIPALTPKARSVYYDYKGMIAYTAKRFKNDFYTGLYIMNSDWRFEDNSITIGRTDMQIQNDCEDFRKNIDLYNKMVRSYENLSFKKDTKWMSFIQLRVALAEDADVQFSTERAEDIEKKIKAGLLPEKAKDSKVEHVCDVVSKKEKIVADHNKQKEDLLKKFGINKTFPVTE